MQDGARWFKMDQDCARWCKMVQDGTRWCNIVQDSAIPCNTMQHHAIPCNTMQYHAIPCNTMQYNAIPCNTMQYHASLITADGAYHCPVGSIWLFLAPSGALIAIPTYYWSSTHFFRSHRSSTLDFHFLSHYSYIKAIMLCEGKTRQDSGILWNTLAYSGILWHTLAYSGILWHTLTYPGIL